MDEYRTTKHEHTVCSFKRNSNASEWGNVQQSKKRSDLKSKKNMLVCYATHLPFLSTSLKG